MGDSLFDITDVVIISAIVVGLGVYLFRKKPSTSSSHFSQNTSSNPINRSTPGSQSLNSSSSLSFKMKQQNKDVVVFYGSQTGTAEDYANRLALEGRQYGFETMAADLESYELGQLSELSSNQLAIFLVSTYGEGEPTDNAQEAYRFLQETDEKGLFSNLKFTVFGLGNKTYEHYNAIGKFFDSKLEDLGGMRVFELGLGDDDGSLEEDYIQWRDKLLPELCKLFGKEMSNANQIVRQFTLSHPEEGKYPPEKIYKGQIGKLPKPGSIQSTPPYDLKNPYYSEIVCHKELMKGGDRNCMHIEFKVKDTPITYQTGDHLGIFPENDKNDVELLAKRLNISNLDQLFFMTAIDPTSSKKHPFPSPCSYRTALTHYLDIQSTPRMHILKALIEYTEEESEKKKLEFLVSTNGKEDAHKFLHSDCRNILDVLDFFKSSSPPADLILELLPRLQCRYYSISSSNEVHPETISICATVLQYNTPTGRLAKGVCTNWLLQMSNCELQSYRIPIYVRRSNFKLPKNLSKPVIMVGPGTGVAPFRGFIEERSKKRKDGKTVGPTVLFFGARTRNHEYIYGEELEKYASDGDLELFCAFSRDQQTKIYVQDRMKEQSKLLWAYLQQGAYFYVCGDAKNMARDVNKILIEIVKEYGPLSETEAIAYVKDMRTKGRYLEDVWS